MSYVDGYLLSVPKDNLDAYKKMAERAGTIWMKHGALAYKECVGDDLAAEWSKFRFPEAAGTKEDEVVLFSFIVFKSREHRDEVNAKVHEDPELTLDYNPGDPMPFDMERMAYGGFKPIVDL